MGDLKLVSGGDEFAAEGDFDVLDDGPGWEVKDIGEAYAGFEIDIVDHAGGGIMEMAVLAEVRAVAGGFALEVDLPDDAVLHERFEAVVNCSERDVREPVLGPHEDLVGRRVVPLLDENPVNFLALPRHAQTGNFLGNIRNGVGIWGVADHRGGNLGADPPISRIILITVQKRISIADPQWVAGPFLSKP